MDALQFQKEKGQPVLWLLIIYYKFTNLFFRVRKLQVDHSQSRVIASVSHTCFNSFIATIPVFLLFISNIELKEGAAVFPLVLRTFLICSLLPLWISLWHSGLLSLLKYSLSWMQGVHELFTMGLSCAFLFWVKSFSFIPRYPAKLAMSCPFLQTDIGF